MNCWGWATWHDRWKHFEKKPKKIVSTWNKKKIKGFNFDNSINFYSQIFFSKQSAFKMKVPFKSGCKVYTDSSKSVYKVVL